MRFICKMCKYNTNNKSNFNRHLKSKKHIKNCENVCECGKLYKTRSGLWKHKKICNYIMQLKIMELEKKNELMEKKTNQMMEIMHNSTSGMSTIAKNNKDIINEVKKLKQTKNQLVTQNITNNQTNNIQNLSINVFLNEHCQNAMCLTDFIDKLQITFED